MDGGIGMAQVVCCAFKLRLDGGIGMALVVCCAFKLRLGIAQIYCYIFKQGATDMIQIDCPKFELKHLVLP